jgi:hypothetical protein
MTEPIANTSGTVSEKDVHRPLAAHLQELEAYLDQLLVALQAGELPVNLQRVTQVFDRILITDLPRLSLTPEKLVTTYNEVPSLLTAYSIAANITSESWQKASREQVIFSRELNGNYWIVPMQEPANCAWLLLNPQRKILFDRLQSLSLAFDCDSSQANLLLKKPALVKLLPTAPPTWQLLQRGELDRSGPIDSGNQALQAEISQLRKELRSLTERNNFLHQRIEQLTTALQESQDSVNLRLEKFKAALLELIAAKQ